MGGTDHHIYYNKKNSLADDLAGITAAVNSAISATGISDKTNGVFSVVPNPARDLIRISANKAVTSATISTIAGQVVINEVYGKGKVNPTVMLNGLAAGVYIVTVVDVDGKSGLQKLVKQ